MSSFPKIRFLTTWFVSRYFHTEARGAENIPASGPFVVAANHASFLDPFFVGYTSKNREVGFLAKEELFRVPLFGTLIKNCGAFPVKRGARDEKAIQQFHDFLHAGKPLVLFPEGTRTLTGELQEARKGVGMLLYNARVPVIPAYISGTFKSWPKGKIFPSPGKTSVTYGPAIPLEDLYARRSEKEVYALIAKRVMAHIAGLREKV
jgi:1-acyl-sn-glycerol-3-phosphate acyltransferase